MKKPRPNHAEYLRSLQRLGPSRRLEIAFELSERARQLFFTGMRMRFPDMPDDELRRLVLRRLAKCHNGNY